MVVDEVVVVPVWVVVVVAVPVLVLVVVAVPVVVVVPVTVAVTVWDAVTVVVAEPVVEPEADAAEAEAETEASEAALDAAEAAEPEAAATAVEITLATPDGSTLARAPEHYLSDNRKQRRRGGDIPWQYWVPKAITFCASAGLGHDSFEQSRTPWPKSALVQ